MAFATYYNFEGEIKHVSKDNLQYELDKVKNTIEHLWAKITILIAMSPMEVSDEEGYKMTWPEYVSSEVKRLRDEIEESYSYKHRLEDAIEAYNQDPKNVHDDSDEWDDENQKWADI